MDKVIDFSKTVYELCKDNEEVIEIMKELGFESIAEKGMLSTAGRFMTIPKGAVIKRIPMDKIESTFIKKGYTIKR